jgi:hypothetical protein
MYTYKRLSCSILMCGFVDLQHFATVSQTALFLHKYTMVSFPIPASRCACLSFTTPPWKPITFSWSCRRDNIAVNYLPVYNGCSATTALPNKQSNASSLHIKLNTKLNSVACSPQANYIDRAAAACQRS